LFENSWELEEMALLPKITLVTPSYNQGGFIKQTIASVLSQGYSDLEYIVVDGGSTDDTLRILKDYGDRLDWVSESDRGQSHAINKGLERATGEVVGFINSDDLLEPGALMRIGKYFSEHPKANWVTGKCRTIDHEGNEIRKGITLYKNTWLLFRSKKILLVLNYISQPATFWRREVMDEVGYFGEQWKYAMDYDYWLRMMKKYNLYYLNSYLASFRVHPTSKAGASANAQFDGALEILKSHKTSALFIGMHKLHDAMTVFIYSKLFGADVTQ